MRGVEASKMTKKSLLCANLFISQAIDISMERLLLTPKKCFYLHQLATYNELLWRFRSDQTNFVRFFYISTYHRALSLMPGMSLVSFFVTRLAVGIRE